MHYALNSTLEPCISYVYIRTHSLFFELSFCCCLLFLLSQMSGACLAHLGTGLACAYILILYIN